MELPVQRNHLPKPPLHGKSLARCKVRPLLLAMDFPVGEKVRGRSFVLCQIHGRPAGHVVAPVSGTHVVRGSRSRTVSASGSDEAISDVEVRAAEMPS